MTGPEQLDLYGSEHRSRGWSIAIVLARIIAILLGLAAGLVGAALYGLRCFDTCPTDPAENTIAQVLTLSLVGFGLVVIIAAASLRTRWVIAGAWITTLLGALMVVGGLVTLVLVPSLQFPGDHSSTITFGLIDMAVGAGVVVSGHLVRKP